MVTVIAVILCMDCQCYHGDGYCSDIVCVFAVCRGVASLELPYSGHVYGVGIGSAGEVVVESEDTAHVYMYQYDAGRFSLLWRKSRPERAREGCWPCVTPDGQLYLYSSVTTKHELYTAQLQYTGTSYEGVLLACLSQQRRALRKRTADRSG